MKLLINTPSLSELGGVSNHFLGLKNKWQFEVKYNTIGSRRKLSGLFYFPFDVLNFILKCVIDSPDIVLLNPSLQNKALFRDVVFLKIAKFFRLKCAVFIHGWDEEVEKQIDLNKINFYGLYKKSDLIFVLANRFKSKLIEWGFDCPIELTTTKVNDDLLTTFDIEKKLYDQSILFLSRIEETKGIYLVLDAFNIFYKSNPSFRLTIAGTGSELDQVKNYVDRNGIKNVEFAGRVSGENLIQTFSKHSIYFFPTYYGEGMPTSLLEAMAFGQVIITRPVGGIPDFFNNDKMGFITDSKSANDYVKILENINSNFQSINKIGRFNHKYAQDNFLASKVVQQLENCLIKLN